MMGYGSGGGMFFGLLMMLGLVLLLAVTVWAIGGGFRRGSDGIDTTSRGSIPAEPPARRLLDERYARGELSAEEYQERLRVLGQSDECSRSTAEPQ